MSDFTPRPLPEHPSLEQLHKQAKERLRELRAAGASPQDIRLADAQFAIAREYGFETWAKLKHQIEALRPSGLEQFEKLAKDIAAAYCAGNATAIREINWNLGTSFTWDHEPVKMQQRLPNWFAASEGGRTKELALGDGRTVVAQFYGFENWVKFAESVAQPPRDPKSAPVFLSSRPPFFRIDWKDNRIGVRGPQSESDWDTLIELIKEHRITKLTAGGMTDAAMERIPELDHLTHLQIGGAALTDEGVRHLARMPQLQDLEMGGWTSPITDRGLEALRHLTELRQFQSCWTQGISDSGLANLAFCDRLEHVNLLGTPAGDGTIRALMGKRWLRHFVNGRGVTDAGIPLLHHFPVFKTWQGGEMKYSLMSPDAEPNRLLLDGPFTDAGLASLAGLDGLFGLTFFWHCPAWTSAGLEPLKHLPNLGFLGCQDQHCDDEAMRHIAAIPKLRMLMGQGAVASDDGWMALSKSQSIEHIWGRECPNLTGRGFASLANMPSLRGIAVSCKNVGDASLSTLPSFPALRQLMPMDVPDTGFRHVGRCENLDGLWCMYCQDTGDAATEHIAGLKRLKHYYAGKTRITDRSLEILGKMDSLEILEFWQCSGLTNAGIARLAALPQLREIGLDGLSGVTRDAVDLFPSGVRVNFSG
jgi:hypothetical protein